MSIIFGYLWGIIEGAFVIIDPSAIDKRNLIHTKRIINTSIKVFVYKKFCSGFRNFEPLICKTK